MAVKTSPVGLTNLMTSLGLAPEPVIVGVVSFVVLPDAGVVIVGGLPLTTGVVGVIGVAALLAVLASPGAGDVVALNCGDVPTVPALGVAGTTKPLLTVGLIGPGVVQVTVWLAVLQLHPLLVNVAGALTPVGSVTVVVIGPVAAPGPLLVTVTGTLLG